MDLSRSIRRLAAAVIATAALQSAAQTGPARSPIVIVGDVHGAFDSITTILQAAGIVDENLRWRAGTTRFVSLGDLIDRGPGSRRVVELMMRLETEAAAAGGEFHIVLGNHELMNLTGDLRYITTDEYQGYVDEAGVAARGQARADWDGEPAAFDARYPPGYFAHRRLFAADGEFGRWLLKKPAIVVLDEIAFVHAGLPTLIGGDVAAVNRDVARQIGELLDTGARLRQAGLLAPDSDLLTADPISTQPVEEGVEAEEEPPAVLSPDWQRLRQLQQSPLLLGQGPFWYRGNALCHPLLERARLDATLRRIGARRVVVGHTPTATRRVRSKQGGLVIQADTGMLKSYYRGRPFAVVYETGAWSIVDETGKRAAFDPDAPPVDRLDGPLQAVLANGDIARPEAEVDPAQGEIVTVTAEGVTVRARFVEMARRQADREVAAYTLDRMLDLYLVPVTVPRTFDGRDGVLVYWRGPWLSETRRIEEQRYRDNPCEAGNDYQLVSLLDSLIRHPRPLEGYQYLNNTLALQLTGHGQAFGTDRTLLAYPESQQPVLSADAADRLRALTLDAVMEQLPQLSARQAKALVARRDAILRQWPHRGALPAGTR